jgi:ribA/ribD-fused uncharacterized protein
VFSQWWPAAFKADSGRYPTAEHYMMAEKARLFGDDEMLEKIRRAESPADAKKLGRKVRGFDVAELCGKVGDGAGKGRRRIRDGESRSRIH